MKAQLSSHRTAVFQALLVTFLWSTSFVLIKIGLVDIPTITFTGLRYSLVFLFMLPFGLRSSQINSLRTLKRIDWLRLIIAGIAVLANSFSSVLGRRINRESKIDPILVTTISMRIDAIALLVAGIYFQGTPQLVGSYGFSHCRFRCTGCADSPDSSFL